MSDVSADDQESQISQGSAIALGLGLPRVRSVAVERRPSGRFLISAGFLVVFVAVGCFAPWIASHDPTTPDLLHRLKPPSVGYPFGTDDLGRDVLTRIIYGARTTLIVGIFALAVGAGIGVSVGLVAGYFGGLADLVISRTIDAMLAFPAIFFGLVLAVTLGPGLKSVVLAVSLVVWAQFARVIRTEVASLRHREFVLQARVAGCSRLRIMLVHLLPNLTGTIMALISINLGFAVLIEASLSFLGAGIPPSTASWGGMIDEGQNYVYGGWWISVFPGFAILATILAFNTLGDLLQSRFDPRRGREMG